MLGVLLCEAEQQRPGAVHRTRCADRAVPLAAAGAYSLTYLPGTIIKDTRQNNEPETNGLRSGMSPESWATNCGTRRRPAGGDGGGRRRLHEGTAL